MVQTTLISFFGKGIPKLGLVVGSAGVSGSGAGVAGSAGAGAAGSGAGSAGALLHAANIVTVISSTRTIANTLNFFIIFYSPSLI
jgi:hypothetical protein